MGKDRGPTLERLVNLLGVIAAGVGLGVGDIRLVIAAVGAIVIVRLLNGSEGK